MASRDVVAKVRYFARNPPPEALDELGIHTFRAPKGATKEQFKAARHRATEEHEMKILDARTALPGGLAAFSLDQHGFMVVPTPPAAASLDFKDRKTVRGFYYPQLLELAKNRTGATRAFMMSYDTRTESPVNNVMAYAGFAHTDAGPGLVEGWRQTLVKKYKVPEEEASTCDIAMFNVWHPFDRPAYNNALCLLDASSTRGGLLPDGAPNETVKYNPGFKYGEAAKKSVKAFAMNIPSLAKTAEKKLEGPPGDPEEAATRERRTTRTKEHGTSDSLGASFNPMDQTDPDTFVPPFALGPLHEPQNRWYFISDQRPEEAWLFKQYDTREGGAAKCSFHTSFYDPAHDGKPLETHGRRSVELRLLLTFAKEEPAAASKL